MNSNGQTPLEVAITLGYRECAQLIGSVLTKSKQPVVVRIEQPDCDTNNQTSTTLSKQHTKHNRVASDPFNIIRSNQLIGGNRKKNNKTLHDLHQKILRLFYILFLISIKVR